MRREKGTLIKIRRKGITFSRKAIYRCLAFFIIAVFILASVPQKAQTATIKMNLEKESIYTGEKIAIKGKGIGRKAYWKSSDKKVATVSKYGEVLGKKTGKVTISVKSNGRTYYCKITVKKPQLNCREKTLREGQSFRLKIKGASVREWTSSDESVVVVNQKGKVTAKGIGTGIITCRTKDEKYYPCVFTVKKSKKHVHKYASEITLAPTCCSEGVESFVCSCGDSYSKNIAATGLHQYETAVTQPQCSAYGYTTYYCKDCGYSYQSDYVLPLEHDMEEQVIHEVDEAHCMEYDKTYDVCKRCGYMYFLGGAGVEKHDFTSIVVPPTETEAGYTLYTCSNCGKEVKGDETTFHTFSEEKSY